MAQKRRLWRLLHGRGGWDRVRADLLAASDPDPGISGSGKSDLGTWLQHAAVRMWRAPNNEQQDDLLQYLPTAGLTLELRQAIEFRANLPITQRPRRAWDPPDAAILM